MWAGLKEDWNTRWYLKSSEGIDHLEQITEQRKRPKLSPRNSMEEDLAKEIEIRQQSEGQEEAGQDRVLTCVRSSRKVELEEE